MHRRWNDDHGELTIHQDIRAENIERRNFRRDAKQLFLIRKSSDPSNQSLSLSDRIISGTLFCLLSNNEIRIYELSFVVRRKSIPILRGSCTGTIASRGIKWNRYQSIFVASWYATVRNSEKERYRKGEMFMDFIISHRAQNFMSNSWYYYNIIIFVREFHIANFNNDL